jgi:hypothetical protein
VVGEDVPARLDKAIEQFGSTSVSVLSRLVKWVAANPDSEIVASVLGIHPGEIDLSASILRQMKDE